ncbi:hypothetical protein RND81_03G135700 [Saponaria officinalis]|uniref:SET domain-containing protein n=1 Tax=Saponaria officinalis TaxID=3572 RepID=A0AAW1M7Y1_SAPOF
MEKLKSIIPWEITKTIQQQTTSYDLPSTSSTIHHFFSKSPLFHSMIEDLTNTELGYFVKNKKIGLELKSKGNSCFSAQDYSQALQFYSQALRVAPVDAVDKDNNLVATLYVNRASSLHKLNLFEESVRDCSRALSISPNYAKAWYRRGKVKTSLLNYEEAISDLKVAMKMEGTCSGKRQIENDIKLIANQHKSGSSTGTGVQNPSLIDDEVPQSKIQCIATITKGRGMASSCDIPPASLLHREEPYAAIILKKCRETHCHFCFNELPADTVSCSTCSMPLYCSENCQLQAGGLIQRKVVALNRTEDLSDELQRRFSEVTLESHSNSEVELTEHRHECVGVNWPTVLPSEVVLAGRIFVKLQEDSNDAKLDLSHNYGKLLPETKVELHVYSIVLLYCLYHSYGHKVELNGANVAKIIVIISQVKVNSMAIVRMNYQERVDQGENLSPGDAITNHLEQVRVGQAIYLTGSLFNHSCVPNIHAYFISRTLFIRATEFVFSGCPLDLSYGPEVGQSSYRQRQQFLQDNYSFKCECIGCSTINFSDLVLDGLHCANSDCRGVILDHSTADSERQKEIPNADLLIQKHQVNGLNSDDLKDIASLIFDQSSQPFKIQPGRCLKCGSTCDLNFLLAKVDEAEASLRSLQATVLSNKVRSGSLSEALRHFEVLRNVLHPYNKKLAKAQDILAEAFCSDGQTQQALDLCLASIEILKKIYGKGHIAVGNELLKLSSLQLAIADAGAADTVNQMDTIFSKYYGRHAHGMFPYLKHLKAGGGAQSF